MKSPHYPAGADQLTRTSRLVLAYKSDKKEAFFSTIDRPKPTNGKFDSDSRQLAPTSD